MTRFVNSELGLRDCWKKQKKTINSEKSHKQLTRIVDVSYLAGEADDAHQGVGLEVEDEDLGRADDREVVDRGVYAAVQDPEPVTPVRSDAVNRYQLRAVEVAFSRGVPIP